MPEIAMLARSKTVVVNPSFTKTKNKETARAISIFKTERAVTQPAFVLEFLRKRDGRSRRRQ
jgi:hypothetical protein